MLSDYIIDAYDSELIIALRYVLSEEGMRDKFLEYNQGVRVLELLEGARVLESLEDGGNK